MPTRQHRVVVVGSLNVDLVVRTNRVPLAGETLAGTGFARFSGGKGANQAVAAARLGAKVHMLGRIGADLFGDDQLRSLQSYGVDTTGIIRDESTTTGVAVIVIEEPSAQNRIIIVPGANGRCTPADVERQRPLFAQAAVVVAQLEIPLPVVEATARLARETGALFILNPAPACRLSAALLSMVDVVTPNESEAEILTGVPVVDAESAARAAAALHEAGARQVVITLGARGALAFDGQERHYLPAHAVQAVDTVAAGDCFTGALAVALGEGMPLAEAAAFANAAAAVAVTRHGAQSSMPTRAEVAAQLHSV